MHLVGGALDFAGPAEGGMICDAGPRAGDVGVGAGVIEPSHVAGGNPGIEGLERAVERVVLHRIGERVNAVPKTVDRPEGAGVLVAVGEGIVTRQEGVLRAVHPDLGRNIRVASADVAERAGAGVVRGTMLVLVRAGGSGRGKRRDGRGGVGVYGTGDDIGARRVGKQDK